ncbi:MAG TPA: hypothetical protein VH741_07435, partial [Candidatus Limnocylindrales bacterium]
MSVTSGALRGLVIVLLVSSQACAGSAPVMAPCREGSTDPLCPTRGSAHVVVTGFESETFDAPLDPSAQSPPSLSVAAGFVQLSYRDRNRLPTYSFAFAGARATADAQAIGATILIHGSGYVTADGCTLTLSEFDSQ